MTCEELLKALNEHVDGAELTEICEEFSQHLAGCNPCQVVVDNIRQDALYFSREPIPSPWSGIADVPMYMQTGVIAFRREALFL